LSKSINLAIKNKYNSILVIINKFIKYLYIIIFKEKFIVEQLKYIVLNQLIQYYYTSTFIRNIEERFDTLKRFVDIFKQCKQLFNNNKLQFCNRNNKLKLRIN